MTQPTSLSSSSPQSGAIRQTAPSASTRSPDSQQVLANRLAERLGLDKGSLGGKAEDYAPSRVAETVLGFISGRLERERAEGGDVTQLQKRFDQAQKGIEQGFAEARKILDGMGVLTGKIAEDIDQSYSLIKSGMAGLAKDYLPAAEGSPGLAFSASASRMTALAESFELSVSTREGDRLRIRIAQASLSESSSQVNASVTEGGSQISLSSRSSQLQVGMWQIELEGDLNGAERKALEDLLGQVQTLAGQFYAGDLDGAFDRAMALNMDGNQLASMSLSLTQTSIRQVSETYGRVAGPATAASAVNPTLREYAQGLLEALRSAETVTNAATDMLSEMLKGGFSLDERFDQGRLDKAVSLNDLLLEGLAARTEQAE